MIWVDLRLAWFQQPGMFNFQAKSRMMNLEFVHPLPFFKSWAAQKQVSGFHLHRPNSGRILPPASPALTALRCQRHWRLRCPAGRLAFGCLFTRQVRSCQFTSVYITCWWDHGWLEVQGSPSYHHNLKLRVRRRRSEENADAEAVRMQCCARWKGVSLRCGCYLSGQLC